MDKANFFTTYVPGWAKEADAMPLELKLKLDDKGVAVLEEGRPVYIGSDDKEIALDPPQMYQKIIDLGAENKKRREGLDSASTQLKLFEGIDDLSVWKEEADKALETVTNYKDKDWLRVDKVDKLKKDMKEAFDDQLDGAKKSFGAKEVEHQGVVGKKDKQIRELMVSNRFATSVYFSGTSPKTNLPPEIAETYFGSFFKVEEEEKTGKLVLIAYDARGDQIYSRANPGERAEFDEAMAAIFDAYPGKDKLLKGSAGGSGGSGGTGDSDGGDTDELKKLEQDYAEALKLGDAKKAIVLKNRLFRAKSAIKSAV